MEFLAEGRKQAEGIMTYRERLIREKTTRKTANIIFLVALAIGVVIVLWS